jgi:hypothetical protein
MNAREKALDVSVATLLLLCLVWAVAMVSFVSVSPGSINRVRESLESHSSILTAFAVLTCLVLLLWVTAGRGLDSRLWSWLPPLVFFCWLGRLGRALVVGLLILGTLLGVLGDYLGLAPL